MNVKPVHPVRIIVLSDPPASLSDEEEDEYQVFA